MQQYKRLKAAVGKIQELCNLTKKVPFSLLPPHMSAIENRCMPFHSKKYLLNLTYNAIKTETKRQKISLIITHTIQMDI